MADGNNYQHPGVYIQELPGLPSVQGASTSTPVFIGGTEILSSVDRNVARRITGWAQYQQEYGSFVWGAGVGSAVYEFFAEGGAVCYVVGISPDTEPTLASASIDDAAGTFKFEAASAGDWPNALLQLATMDVGSPGTQGGAANYFSVNVVVAQADVTTPTSVWAKLLGVFVRENSIKPTLIGAAGATVPFYILESFGAFSSASLKPQSDGSCPMQNQINAKSMFIRVVSVDTTSADQTKSRQQPPTAFDSGSPVTYDASMYTEALPALAAIPDASLVATPDAAVFDMSTGVDFSASAASFKGVIETVQAECDKHTNVFYVIDAPYVDKPSDTSTMLDFVTGATDNLPLLSDRAAIYYPWPLVLNPFTGARVPVVPCGPVLGRIAHTDLTAGVHVSPAGVLNGRISTAMSMTGWLSENDQSLLNVNGINAIRAIQGYGITIYGARTFAVGTQWQYLAVSRFVRFVEQSLKMSLQWVVFEPNSTFLWTTVIREVTNFLSSLWNQGALFGATEGQAFFVTCDETNNPPELRMKGILNVDIGLAPVFPAEFVVVRIAQITSTSSSGS